MKHPFQALSLALIFIAGTALGEAGASIYEYTDEEGVPSFSDQPVGPDANKVQVKPNIVEVAPTVMPEPLPEPVVESAPEPISQPSPPEVEEGGDNYYYDGTARRREEIKRRLEQRERPVQPIHPAPPIQLPIRPIVRPMPR